MLKNPFILMGFSILLYSLFPLFGALGQQQTSPFIFAGASQMAAFAFILLLLLMRAGGFGQLRRALVLFRRDAEVRNSALGDGSLNLLSHSLLFLSFQYTTETSATILFESWPLFGLLATVFLLKGDFARNSKRNFALGLVAFLGLGLVTLASVNPANDPRAASWLLGNALAVGAAVCMALSVAFIVRLRVRLAEDDGTKEGAVLLPNILSKGCATIIFLILMAIWQDRPAVSSFAGQPLLLMAINGTVIVALGSLCYQEALAIGRRTEVILMWYITPLLAVIWLASFGLSPISETLILGAFFILSANLLLNTRADESSAYVAVFITLCVVSTILLFLPPLQLSNFLPEVGLVELVGLPLSLFGILTGFALDRRFIRRQEKEDLLAELAPVLNEREHELLQTTLESERQADIDPAFCDLCTSLEHRAMDEVAVLRRLRMKLTPAVDFGELLVLWALGGLTTIAITLFRPDGVIGDIIAILTVSSLIYLLLLISGRTDASLPAMVQRIANPDRRVERSKMFDRRLASATLIALYGLQLVLSLERDGVINIFPP